MRVTVLAGGYGGSRFALAVAETVGAGSLTVIGNVGDDLEVLGLHVSPDLDSIVYTLAGVFDHERGWGRADESWNALEEVGRLGGEDWFRVGDRDLGLHLVRTVALRGGERLSAVTARLTAAFGVEANVLPATDDLLRTRVHTPAGELSFQEWFVARRHEDPVNEVVYAGAESAEPAPGVVEALDGADLIALAPSNPYMSIGPILAVPEVRHALERRRVPCVAVSALIGGKTVKGPADSMLERLAGGTSPRHVAACYPGLIDALVIDEADADEGDDAGVPCIVTRTLMSDAPARRRVAEAALDAAAVPR